MIQILNALRGTFNLNKYCQRRSLESVCAPRERDPRGGVQSRDHRGSIVSTVTRKISGQYFVFIYRLPRVNAQKEIFYYIIYIYYIIFFALFSQLELCPVNISRYTTQ